MASKPDAASTPSARPQRPPIIRRLEIDAPIEDVWRAITEGAEIQRWFAPHAESRPGPGGIIKLGWTSDVTWDMPIAEWEPPRRLVIGDEGAAGTEGLLGEEPGQTALRIEYTLESRSAGATVLRLVHSGFDPAPEWDEMYDGTCTGWTFELNSLKHYLENHKGQPRWLVRAAAPVGVSKDQAWQRLFSADGLGLAGGVESLREGGRFEADPATGERLTGRVDTCVPHCLGVVLDQHNGAMLRVLVERWCGAGNRMEAQVWLSAYDVDRAVGDAFAARWTEVLTRLFAS